MKMELRVRIEDIFKRDGYGVTLSSRWRNWLPCVPPKVIEKVRNTEEKCRSLMRQSISKMTSKYFSRMHGGVPYTVLS